MMKHHLSLALFLSILHLSFCGPEGLTYSESIGIEVSKVGSFPVERTDDGSYNTLVTSDNAHKRIFFFDQYTAEIHLCDEEDGSISQIWDVDVDELPDGVDISWAHPGGAQTARIQNVLPTHKKNEVVVVLGSLTLPSGWEEPDVKLPAPGAYPAYWCGSEFTPDIYRTDFMVSCMPWFPGAPEFMIYFVFATYTLHEGKLVNPEPWFVQQAHATIGHIGGGAALLEDGSYLWATGDNLPFGTDGLYAPQVDWEGVGKILRVYKDGSYEVLAKGVRNSQVINIIKGKEQKGIKRSGKKSKGRKHDDELVVFMDIGGRVAEEVNVISLSSLLDTTHIDNFGWGRNTGDGKSREGTFYIQQGAPGIMDSPPYLADAPVPEEGYIQPWIQFGRGPVFVFYAIASHIVPQNDDFEELKLIWSEMNTGLLMGTFDHYDKTKGPSKGYILKAFDESGKYFENGLNDLVTEELGVPASRGDPRFFQYSDGSVGVMIERTGTFYKLKEVDLPR